MGLTLNKGFFSYAHGDDVRNSLTELKQDLITESHQVTGEELQIFFDKDGISWGDLWQDNIVAGIDSSAFFIPILSPLYFKSSNCLAELKQFLEKINRGASKELFLPIYFIDIKDLASVQIDEDLLNSVFSYQYEDWRDIRFASRSSEKYRAAVGRLAARLARANSELERKSIEVEDGKRDKENNDNGGLNVNTEIEDNSHGFLDDSIFNITQQLPILEDHLNKATGLMQKIGDIPSKYTIEIQSHQFSDSASLSSIFARMSIELQPVSKEYLVEAKRCEDLIFKLDPSIRSVINIQNKFNALAESQDNNSTWRESVAELAINAKTAHENLDKLNDALSALKYFSRILYKPLRDIEQANTIFGSGFEIVANWAEYKSISLS